MASIQRRTTSSGEVRFDVCHRVRGREVSRTFKRRQDADAYRRQAEHAELTGLMVDPRGGRITFGDWWEQWWPSTVHLRPSTRARDEAYYNRRIAPTFKEARLDRIDRAALRQWISELRAAGLAPATVHKAAQIVSKVLRAAVDDGRIARNPAERLELPRIERDEMRFLTPGEVSELAEAIDPAFRALVYLGAYGGLRLGEMFALRRERLNLLHGRVEVVATLGEVRGQIIENAPKTKAGRRSVPLPRVAIEALDEHLRRSAPVDHVFTAPEGGPVRAGQWRTRRWHPACVAAGFGEHVKDENDREHYRGLRPHDLRHTAVALWIAAGASPNEVASRAGHSSVVTVLDRYGHLLPGTGERVTAALDELAAGASGQK